MQCTVAMLKDNLLAERQQEKSTQKLTDDSPKTILLSDVVRTGTERLLSTDGESAGVHQVTKELPSCE